VAIELIECARSCFDCREDSLMYAVLSRLPRVATVNDSEEEKIQDAAVTFRKAGAERVRTPAVIVSHGASRTKKIRQECRYFFFFCRQAALRRSSTQPTLGNGRQRENERERRAMIIENVMKKTLRSTDVGNIIGVHRRS